MQLVFFFCAIYVIATECEQQQQKNALKVFHFYFVLIPFLYNIPREYIRDAEKYRRGFIIHSFGFFSRCNNFLFDSVFFLLYISFAFIAVDGDEFSGSVIYCHAVDLISFFFILLLLLYSVLICCDCLLKWVYFVLFIKRKLAYYKCDRSFKISECAELSLVSFWIAILHIRAT